MPLRIRSHIKYDPKPPKPEPKPARVWASKTLANSRRDLTPIQRDRLDDALIKGVPTRVIVKDFMITNNSVQSRKGWLRRNGFMEKSA